MKDNKKRKELKMEKVKEAINTILSDKESYPKSLNYAVNYCRYALTITDIEEMKIQVIYILGNITHWRHVKAIQVRKTLKKFAGIK